LHGADNYLRSLYSCKSGPSILGEPESLRKPEQVERVVKQAVFLASGPHGPHDHIQVMSTVSLAMLCQYSVHVLEGFQDCVLLGSANWYEPGLVLAQKMKEYGVTNAVGEVITPLQILVGGPLSLLLRFHS